MGARIDASAFLGSLRELEKHSQARRQACARAAARSMEVHARLNAPWKNQSGRARAGLRGSVRQDGERLIIALGGSVRHLVYLELAHGGKYAVLRPTLKKNRAQILHGFARIGD